VFSIYSTASTPQEACQELPYMQHTCRPISNYHSYVIHVFAQLETFFVEYPSITHGRMTQKRKRMSFLKIQRTQQLAEQSSSNSPMPDLIPGHDSELTKPTVSYSL
jgi:hypothetical protein